jgi:hypothetical protein
MLAFIVGKLADGTLFIVSEVLRGNGCEVLNIRWLVYVTIEQAVHSLGMGIPFCLNATVRRFGDLGWRNILVKDRESDGTPPDAPGHWKTVGH